MINEVIEMLKTYTDGKDNTDKVEISVMQLNRIIKALEQQPTDAVDRVTIKEYIDSFNNEQMTAEEYRQRMVQAFHNADCGELIAVCVLPTEKEFEHLEWLLKNHYKKEPCEDCVRRSEVFAIAWDSCLDLESDGDTMKFCDEIKALPSVTPKAETVTEFADRCRECGAKYGKLLKQELCEDAISRQEVLEELDKSKYSNAFCEEHHIDQSVNLGMAHIVVNELKPVTPQPKMGKWKEFTHSAYHGNDEDGEPIWREVTVYHCDLCNRRTVIKENYCPNCGAKMQEAEE